MYRNYYDSYWSSLVEVLNIDHTPHCTRHTCISILIVAGVDDKAIKKIVGHKGQSATEVIYTTLKLRN
ncbi:tyrosine-type recombinase/integrase [Lachnospiraceae bacterium 50-23]